ncbi:hypothetical protein ACET3Z_015128 [Daucus carota]
MVVYVPAFLADQVGRMVQVGNLYMIKNFEVQDYTEKDKFRPVRMDKKIKFTTATKISDLDENETFIPKNMFDLFQFSDLKKVAQQVLYLADVIGILPKKEKLNDFNNRHGKPQKNIKFKLFDGKTKINVTFWDSFATQFIEALEKVTEDPIILIITSARVTSFHEQIDICNYSPTTFYINYDHHTVHKLRKDLNNPDFSKKQICAKTKSLNLLTVEQIKNLGKDSIEDEVVCKAILKCLEEYTSWKYFVCTSCYTKVETDNNGYTCGACKREVVEPNQKFAIHVIASDPTGELDLMLDDRAVRTLLEEINLSTTTEDDGIAEMLQMLNGKGYTVKVSISQANVEKKDKVFLATDIFSGFDYEENKGGQRQIQENSESFTAQPSTSSYHLDDISQLNYNAT